MFNVRQRTNIREVNYRSIYLYNVILYIPKNVSFHTLFAVFIYCICGSIGHNLSIAGICGAYFFYEFCVNAFSIVSC